MTRVQYCHLCFRVGQKCGCSSIPHQTPSQASALWTPPMMSYMAMASSTETTASSSAARVPPLRYPPPGLPPLEPMDMLLAPTSLVSVGAAGDKVSQAHPLLLASTKRGPWPHNSGCPPPEGRRQTR